MKKSKGAAENPVSFFKSEDFEKKLKIISHGPAIKKSRKKKSPKFRRGDTNSLNESQKCPLTVAYYFSKYREQKGSILALDFPLYDLFRIENSGTEKIGAPEQKTPKSSPFWSFLLKVPFFNYSYAYVTSYFDKKPIFHHFLLKITHFC